MSTFKVPLTGSNIVHEGDSGPGLGHTLMDREPSQPSERPGFTDGIFKPVAGDRNEKSRYHAHNGLGRVLARGMEQRAQAEAPAPTPPPTPTPSPSGDYAAMQQRIADLERQVASSTQNPQPQYADGALGDLQRRTAEVPQYGYDQQYSQDYGDADYEVYDTAQVKEAVRLAVEADRESRRNEADSAALLDEAGALYAKYGQDANYSEVLEMALRECAEAATAKQPYSITEAYKRASLETEARSGRRGGRYMPKSVRGLGQQLAYKAQTGRMSEGEKRKWGLR